MADTIGNDVGCPGHHHFSGSGQATRAPYLRLRSQGVESLQNSGCYKGCGGVGIPCDISPDRNQMTDGFRRPDNLHRGRFCSSAVPQDFNQEAAFSWLIAWPESSSVIAVCSSFTCQASCSTKAAIASAARKDFDRFDVCASMSSRALVSESSLIERVSVIACTRLYTN